MKLIQFSKKLLFVPVAAGALLCSCMEATDDGTEKNTLTVDPESSFTYNINGEVNFFDSTEQEDSEYDEKEFKNTITINFNGDETPTYEYNGVSKDEVTIDSYETKGSAHLIINAEKKVNYILKGTSENGSLLIRSQKKFKLTLDNLNLSNSAGLPAICSQTKKRCFIETIGTARIKDAEGDDTYSLGEAYDADDDAKGAIFSEGELIFCGNGTLEVEGRCKHAIVSDQYVRISSGTLNIIGSKKDGIHTNDAVLINGGVLNIKDVGKSLTVHPTYAARKMNGIQCEKGYIVIKDGKINITSPGIGIYASKKEFNKSDVMTEKSFIYIAGGEIDINTTGLEGHGIRSRNHLIIKGNAKIDITATGEEAKGIETDGNEKFATGNELEYGDIVLAGGEIKLFSIADVVDPAGKINILGGTVTAVGGSCFDKTQLHDGSKNFGVATFTGEKKQGEEVVVGDAKLFTLAATLDDGAKVLLIKDGLVAGTEVKIGSKPGTIEIK